MLLGDDSAGGPVLKSNSESHVFVYFVDHGGKGLICTPGRSKDWIYADELDETLQAMKDANMFKELTFYLEACESGSMFPNLDESEKIYAVTASNATQSSYAAYCGTSAKVNGKRMKTCLADLFSINWMLDTESAELTSETLQEQYDTVVEKTNLSPVQKFGDFSFMSEPIGIFEGTTDSDDTTITEKYLQYATHLYKKALSDKGPEGEFVDSRDHDLHYLYNEVMETGAKEDMEALKKELDHRMFVDGLFSHLELDASEAEFVSDYDCLRMMVSQVE